MQAYTKYHHCRRCSSWEINLNIRVEVRADSNDDRLMDQQTDGQKTKSLYHAMLKAGATKSLFSKALQLNTALNIHKHTVFTYILYLP